MASLKDISKICGVSVATVSKALNDHKDIGEENKSNYQKGRKGNGIFPEPFRTKKKMPSVSSLATGASTPCARITNPTRYLLSAIPNYV